MVRSKSFDLAAAPVDRAETVGMTRLPGSLSVEMRTDRSDETVNIGGFEKRYVPGNQAMELVPSRPFPDRP